MKKEQQKDYLSDGERKVQYVYTLIPSVHSIPSHSIANGVHILFIIIIL